MTNTTKLSRKAIQYGVNLIQKKFHRRFSHDIIYHLQNLLDFSTEINRKILGKYLGS